MSDLHVIESDKYAVKEKAARLQKTMEALNTANKILALLVLSTIIIYFYCRATSTNVPVVNMAIFIFALAFLFISFNIQDAYSCDANALLQPLVIVKYNKSSNYGRIEQYDHSSKKLIRAVTFDKMVGYDLSKTDPGSDLNKITICFLVGNEVVNQTIPFISDLKSTEKTLEMCIS